VYAQGGAASPIQRHATSHDTLGGPPLYKETPLKLEWGVWFYGLVSGFIARRGSIAAGFGGIITDPEHFSRRTASGICSRSWHHFSVSG